MTSKTTQLKKRLDRNLVNLGRKIINADARLKADIELGTTVIVTEVDGVKSYAFPAAVKTVEPPTPNKLTWISGRVYRHADPRKSRSGYKQEHGEALIEDASRSFAKEVTKALEVPVTVGEFADHDPVQGAAIDNSIATGKNLFA